LAIFSYEREREREGPEVSKEEAQVPVFNSWTPFSTKISLGDPTLYQKIF
jgi:hypothetical protein